MAAIKNDIGLLKMAKNKRISYKISVLFLIFKNQQVLKYSWYIAVNQKSVHNLISWIFQSLLIEKIYF